MHSTFKMFHKQALISFSLHFFKSRKNPAHPSSQWIKGSDEDGLKQSFSFNAGRR